MPRKLAAFLTIFISLPTTGFLLYALLIRRDLFPLAVALAILLSLVGIAILLIASVVYRIREGKPIFAPRFPDALFHERWASGVGRKEMRFFRPTANNCLWVAVLADRLRVGPMFPFTLMFLPERFGMEYDIPLEHLIAVDQHRSRFGGVSLSVRFRSDDDNETDFILRVRDPQRLISVIEGRRMETAACPTGKEPS